MEKVEGDNENRNKIRERERDAGERDEERETGRLTAEQSPSFGSSRANFAPVGLFFREAG